MTEHQRRALVCVLKDAVFRSADRERLLAHARGWLYEHQVLMVHDRVLRGLVAAALAELEAETALALRQAVAPELLQRWIEAASGTRADGQAVQSWLWAPPAKHSTRQVAQMFERIGWLVELGVNRVLWRRAVRNGTVWIEHSLSFHGRDRLLLPAERWRVESPRHYARLSLPPHAGDFLAPLLERVRTGVEAVAAAARAGTLRVEMSCTCPHCLQTKSPRR
jgi:hypothetical protein